MIDMADNKITLSKSDRLMVCLRSTFWQASWNYERMQNGGYAFAMIPAIKKLYKEKADQIAALKRHMEFFNTHPYVASPIVGVTLALEQEKANGAAVDDAAIQGVKVGMMGPLAGIGDSLAQFCLAPLFATIGASLAMDGLLMGPILFFLGMNIVLLLAKVLSGLWGYKLGTSIIATLSSKMEQISNVASMIGVTVISGLAVNFVKITTPIKYVAAMPDNQEKIVAIQDMIDAIAPRLLPVLFTGLIFYLIKVKKWTTYKLVMLTIVIGVVLSCLGIIA